MMSHHSENWREGSFVEDIQSHLLVLFFPFVYTICLFYFVDSHNYVKRRPVEQIQVRMIQNDCKSEYSSYPEHCTTTDRLRRGVPSQPVVLLHWDDYSITSNKVYKELKACEEKLREKKTRWNFPT